MQTVLARWVHEDNKLMPWVVCLSAGLFFFYDFIQLNIMSSIGTSLVGEFHLTATQLGRMASVYLDAQVGFLLFSGYLLDRVSTRKLILVGMLASVLSTAWFAVSADLNMMKSARAVAGATGSFCFLSCIVLATRWFKPKQMATVTGIIGSMAMLGGAMAQRPMDMLVSSWGWRYAMLVNAVFGALLFVWMCFFVIDSPDGKSHVRQSRQLSFFKSIAMVIKKPQNWLAGWYTALMNSVVFVLGAVWGTQYLIEVHHLTHTQATSITMMIFFGTTLGSPLVGVISDKMELRKKPMIYGSLMSLVLIFVLMSSTMWSVVSLGIIFFLLGLVTSTQIITYPIIFESNRSDVVGMCESFAAVIILGAGSFLQPFFGMIMDMGKTAANNGYVSSDYQTAICLFPVCFIISFVLSAFLKETGCKKIS